MGFGKVHRRETAQERAGNYHAAAAHPKPLVGQILDSATPQVNATVTPLGQSPLTSRSSRKRKRDKPMTACSGNDRVMPYCAVPSSLFHESPKKTYLPRMVDVVKRHAVELRHYFCGPPGAQHFDHRPVQGPVF